MHLYVALMDWRQGPDCDLISAKNKENRLRFMQDATKQKKKTIQKTPPPHNVETAFNDTLLESFDNFSPAPPWQ